MNLTYFYVDKFREENSLYTAKVAFVSLAKHGLEVPEDVLKVIVADMEKQIERYEKQKKMTEKKTNLITMMMLGGFIKSRNSKEAREILDLESQKRNVSKRQVYSYIADLHGIVKGKKDNSCEPWEIVRDRHKRFLKKK